jgi:hypothetical protein
MLRGKVIGKPKIHGCGKSYNLYEYSYTSSIGT